MNTIEKLMCEVQLLDGLEMHILENSYRKKRCRVHTTTHDEDLEDNFEFDRVFNNVDVIEGMDVSVMEKPHKNRSIRYTIKSLVPTTEYDNKIVVLENYEEKIKGWLNEI